MTSEPPMLGTPAGIGTPVGMPSGPFVRDVPIGSRQAMVRVLRSIGSQMSPGRLNTWHGITRGDINGNDGIA